MTDLLIVAQSTPSTQSISLPQLVIGLVSVVLAVAGPRTGRLPLTVYRSFRFSSMTTASMPREISASSVLSPS